MQEPRRSNPYASPSTSEIPKSTRTGLPFMAMAFNAVCAVAMTVVSWITLVVLFERRLTAYENLFWSVTLWFSAMVCSGGVAWWRYDTRPVLACTVVFGLFGVVYMACEGPIFGNVAQGGAPATTQFVVWNLILLPIGVFAATVTGSSIGRQLAVARARRQPER